MLAPTWCGQVKLASGLSILVGLWLIAAPFALGYLGQPTPTLDDLLVGALIVILSAARFVLADRANGRANWLSWACAILGAWLVVAPFALGYFLTGAATADDVGMGMIVVALGVWAALATIWAPGT